MTNKPTAFLSWSLDVDCPKCNETNDLSDSVHDPEYEISTPIFTSAWEKLEGREVTCEHCVHKFNIEKVEY